MDLELGVLGFFGRTRALLFPSRLLFLLLVSVLLLKPGRFDLRLRLLPLQSGNLVLERLDLFLLHGDGLEQGHHEGRALRLGDTHQLWDGHHGRVSKHSRGPVSSLARCCVAGQRLWVPRASLDRSGVGSTSCAGTWSGLVGMDESTVAEDRRDQKMSGICTEVASPQDQRSRGSPQLPGLIEKLPVMPPKRHLCIRTTYRRSQSHCWTV